METEFVTLKSLSETMSMDRSQLRKYIIAKGFTPFKVRTADSRNQANSALTPEEADRIIEIRASEGFAINGRRDPTVLGDWGYFYMVSPDPEVRPNRVKLGFSKNIDDRLTEYRTISPGATAICFNSCRRIWEQAAMAAVTNFEGCIHVGGEVYECTGSKAMEERMDAFFELMPDISTRRGNEGNEQS